MNKPTAEAEKLIKYIIQSQPATLEIKNSDGDTPLMTACHFGRTDFVKILIAAGADQSARNKAGQNILHVALSGLPHPEQLEPFLNALDKDLLPHLFVTRSNLHNENGVTPFHAFVTATSTWGWWNARRTSYKTDEQWLAVCKLLLKFSGGAELEMLNGAGDTVLATAIVACLEPLIQHLIEFRPSLMYRENAVGRTPVEMARDRVTSKKFKAPGTPSVPNNTSGSVSELKTRSPSEFASGKEKSDANTEANPDNVWKICKEMMEKYPNKRRLVSLHEANDVAKRLGEQYSSSRYFSIQARADDDEEEKEDEDEKVITDFSVQSRDERSGLRWICTNDTCHLKAVDCRCGKE
jgi:hypothetical protein